VRGAGRQWEFVSRDGIARAVRCSAALGLSVAAAACTTPEERAAALAKFRNPVVEEIEVVNRVVKAQDLEKCKAIAETPNAFGIGTDLAGVLSPHVGMSCHAQSSKGTLLGGIPKDVSVAAYAAPIKEVGVSGWLFGKRNHHIGSCVISVKDDKVIKIENGARFEATNSTDPCLQL
jgi:hypothetical protein